MRNERGSLLVASYFLVAVLLSLAIPQSMRALHYTRLVQQNIDYEGAFQAAEAARAHVLRTILRGDPTINLNGNVSNPFFGQAGDNAVDATNPFGAGMMKGVASCNADQGPPGWDPTGWDCWPNTYQLTNAGVNYSVSFRAQETAAALPVGGWVTKRVQLVVYRGDQNTPFTGQWLTTHEVKVRLKRSGTATGVQAGTRLIITEGNGEERKAIKGQYIIGYGDTTASGSNIEDLAPITVSGSQSIWGRVLVKKTPGYEFCCDSAFGPGGSSSLVLTNSGFGINARVRRFPTEHPEYWRTITSEPGSFANAAAYNLFNLTHAPMVAHSDLGEIDAPSDNPLAGLYPDDVPDYLTPEMAAYVPEPVKPTTIAEGGACETREINGPGGSGAHSVTLCAYYDANGNVLPADSEYRQGVCAGAGEFSAQADHHVWRIGQLAADGATVEYCAKAIDIGQATELRVQGDKARVFLRGYKTSSGVPVAMDAGANSTIFAFKKSETLLMPTLADQQEYIARDYGATAAGYAAFRNSLMDVSRLGHLSIEVLESNKWKRASSSASWERYQAAHSMTEVFNKPNSNNRMVPEVRIHGDIFLGTVNAPRSDVTLASDFMETRSTENPLIGYRMWWGGRTLLVTPKSADPTRNTSPDPVELLSWRKCYAEDCSR